MPNLGKIGSPLRPPEQVERISGCGLGTSLTQVTDEFGRDHAGTEACDEWDRRSESLLVVLVGQGLGDALRYDRTDLAPKVRRCTTSRRTATVSVA
jgi:hypothetical protein